MTSRLDGFAPIPLEDAMAVLAEQSGIAESEAVLSDLAQLLGCEAPVLRWAALLARTVGWGPLRARIVGWSTFARAPWHSAVESAIGDLAEEDARLLATLAACDAPFVWDVLESVVPDVSIDAVCRLEEAALLVRSVRSGVVTFTVPFAVRAVHRARGSESTDARWLAAWTDRANELRRGSYGPNARAALTELAAAVPLAARSLFVDTLEAPALVLWEAASDAIFFGEALAFDAPAFGRAVDLADQQADATLRVRARVIAGRARLECGDPVAASRLGAEAEALAGSDDLRIEALRGRGWAAIALSALEDARAFFETARSLAEGEPRGQADANAGLGIAALLGGDAARARELLEEAVAIHVVMRDAPREAALRGMMELLPSEEGRRVGPASADAASEVEALRAKGQRWREALALARLALDARERGDPEVERARLHEARAAAMFSNMPASKIVRSMLEPSASKVPIAVGAEGRELTLPSGERHDLARHGPVRRILWALALARRDRPGVPMTTLEMIDAGWPGEKMQHQAATLRVYTTIRRLRAIGLGDALVTRDDGYLVDPEVAVAIG